MTASSTRRDEQPGSREAFLSLLRLADLLKARAYDVAEEVGLSMPAAMALARLDEPVPMSKLGRQLGYDPSFVTALADALEDHGLVCREVDPADRRVKNLRLTSKGRAMKATIQNRFADDLPGIRNLTDQERDRFVALLNRMVVSEQREPGR